MPQEGYRSVTVDEEQCEQAADYKPDDATWGDVLVAGAERLNEDLDSDTGRFGEELNVDALADRLVDELGAAAGGPQVDHSELAAAVVRRFDYAELATLTADELQTRLR